MEAFITYLTPERVITAIGIVILGIAQYWQLRKKRPPAAGTDRQAATTGSGVKVIIINNIPGGKINRRRRMKRRRRRDLRAVTPCYRNDTADKEE